MRLAAAALGLLALAAPAAGAETLVIEQVGDAGAVLANMPLLCEAMACRGVGALRVGYESIPAVILLRFDLSPGNACLWLQREAVAAEPWRWHCEPRAADGGSARPWRLVAEQWLPGPARRGMDRSVVPWPPTWLDLWLRVRP